MKIKRCAAVLVVLVAVSLPITVPADPFILFAAGRLKAALVMR